MRKSPRTVLLLAGAALAAGAAVPAFAASDNGNSAQVEWCKSVAANYGPGFFAACVTYGYDDHVGSIGNPGSGATAVWVCKFALGPNAPYAQYSTEGACQSDVTSQINDQRKAG